MVWLLMHFTIQRERPHTNSMVVCPLVFLFFSARETHPGKGEATGVQDKNKSEP